MSSEAASEPLSLVLVSASPRRRLLLPLLGFPVGYFDAALDEVPLAGESAEQTAVRLASLKARQVPARAGEIAVGADTVVVLDGQQLGKPEGPGKARRLLRALRGRSHEVITGIALVGTEWSFERATSTLVQMREYSDEELEAFVATGRPMDKAGGYAIQDPEFRPVQSIEGCYLNVVGLPLCAVSEGLKRLGGAVEVQASVPPCHWCRLGQQVLEGAP
jgi:septum formation protein